MTQMVEAKITQIQKYQISIERYIKGHISAKMRKHTWRKYMHIYAYGIHITKPYMATLRIPIWINQLTSHISYYT